MCYIYKLALPFLATRAFQDTMYGFTLFHHVKAIMFNYHQYLLGEQVQQLELREHSVEYSKVQTQLPYITQ